MNCQGNRRFVVGFVLIAVLSTPLFGAEQGGTDLSPVIRITPIPIAIQGTTELGPFQLSPDGQRYAYGAKKGGKWFVVVDEEVHGPYDELPDKFLGSFSIDSKHFAMNVRNGWDCYLAVNGKMGPAFKELDVARIDYSPQNESFACKAYKDDAWGWLVRGADDRTVYHRRADQKRNCGDTQDMRGVLRDVRWAHPATDYKGWPFIYVQTGPDFGNWWLTANHQHVIAVLEGPRIGNSPYGNDSVIVDGVNLPVSGQIRNFWITAAGGHYAYMCLDPNPGSVSGFPQQAKARIVKDGEVIATFTGTSSNLRSTQLWLSPDGSSCAYCQPASTDFQSKLFVVCEGKRFGPYQQVSRFTFSEDSQHYYFVVFKDRGSKDWFFVHDGREYGPFQGTFDYSGRDFVLSPDGTRFALVERAGSTRDKTVKVVVDGKPSPAYEEAYTPIFSSDSRRVAFAARKHGKALVVVDGREGPPERDIPTTEVTPGVRQARIAFSPDSNDFWHIVQRDDRKNHVIRNGEDMFVLDSASDTLMFSADGRHLVGISKDGLKSWGGISVDGAKAGIEDPSSLLKYKSGTKVHTTLLGRSTREFSVLSWARDGGSFIVAISDGRLRPRELGRATCHLTGKASTPRQDAAPQQVATQPAVTPALQQKKKQVLIPPKPKKTIEIPPTVESGKITGGIALLPAESQQKLQEVRTFVNQLHVSSSKQPAGSALHTQLTSIAQGLQVSLQMVDVTLQQAKIQQDEGTRAQQSQMAKMIVDQLAQGVRAYKAMPEIKQALSQ